MYILVSYDISSNKRRNKIDKLLSSFGVRVNYSVFELDINPHEYKEIEFKLSKLMHQDDSVRIYRFTKKSIEDSVELGERRANPFSKEESYVL